jgi:hypothetical protein
MNHSYFIDDLDMQDLGQYKELWPGKWPVPKLLRRKSEIGSQAFAQKYNSETLDDVGRTIAPEKIEQAVRNGFHLKISEFSKKFLDMLTISSGVDLASGKTASAKWTVHLVLGQDDNGLYYVLYVWREKATYPRIKRYGLFETAKTYNPAVIVVENNSIQNWLIEDIAEDDDYSDLPVMPFRTGTNKSDIMEGLPSITTIFQNNRIVIPYGDMQTREVMDPLITELKTLPLAVTTDCVMALWFAHRGMKEVRGEKPGKSFIHNFTSKTLNVQNISVPGQPKLIPIDNVAVFDETTKKYRYRKYGE